MQGTVSQIFYLGLSFYFIKCRKFCLKHKIKTKPLIKNLRHGSLHMNVINKPVKYGQNLYNIKREILDEKI